MSEHEHPSYEGDGGPNSGDDNDAPLRHGWFHYVAVFFIVIAGICFAVSLCLK